MSRRLWLAADEEALIAAYDAYKTYTEIAVEMERARGAVVNKVHHLAQAGRVALRAPNLPNGVDDAIRDLRAKGLTIEAMAQKIGCGRTAVTNRIRKLDIPLPPPSKRRAFTSQEGRVA